MSLPCLRQWGPFSNSKAITSEILNLGYTKNENIVVAFHSTHIINQASNTWKSNIKKIISKGT
jgi:hypothetical protein